MGHAQVYVTIDENGYLVADGLPVRSLHELQKIVEKSGAQSFLKSSSIDFAEEYTSDPAVLEMCEQLSRHIRDSRNI